MIPSLDILYTFLSGLFFVGSLVKKGTKSFITSKVDTILYPYVIWSILQGLIQYYLSSYTNFNKPLSDVYNLFWLPQEQFWFLYVLFLIFLIYTLLHYLVPNIVVLFTLSVLFYLFQNELLSTWGPLVNFYKYGLYFCVGLLFSKCMNLKLGSSFWLGLTLLLFVFVQWYFHYYLDMKYSTLGLLPSFFIAITGIFTVISVSQFLSKIDFWLVKYIGSYSLEIYLVHIIFGSGFRIVLQNYFGIESSFVHLFFGTIIGLFMSILFVKLIRYTGLTFIFYMSKYNKKAVLT